MSKPEDSSPDKSWTGAIHHAISSTSEAIHRVVSAVARHDNDPEPPDTTSISEPSSKRAKSAPTPGTALSSTTETTSTRPVDVTSAPNVTSEDVKTDSSPPNSTTKVTDVNTSPSLTSAAPEPGQIASPTLTESPTRISNTQNDPSSSDPKPGDLDATQCQSKDNSDAPSQTKGEGDSAVRGDKPGKDDASAPDQPQVNKNTSAGSTSETSSQLKGSEDSGSTSKTSPQTSHQDANAKVPVGGPALEQMSKEDKEVDTSPLDEPPKSKEEAADSGTGQKYFKSSGVAAEGGNFDASKPGAGAEASRLLRKEGNSLVKGGHSAEPHEQKTNKQFTEETEEKHGFAAKVRSALHKD